MTIFEITMFTIGCLTVTAVIFAVLYANTNTANKYEDNFTMFTIFNFGFINVPKHNTKLINNLRSVRKDDSAGFETEKSVTFFSAPMWLNKIINVGGTK